MDYQTGESARVTSLPDFGPPLPGPGFVLAAGGIAGWIAPGLCLRQNRSCLTDLDGRERDTIHATGIRAIAWDRTGARLAATSLDYNNFGPVQMLIVSREGEVQDKVRGGPQRRHRSAAMDTVAA